MQSDRNFIRRIGFVIDPVADVIEHRDDVIRNAMRLYANVSCRIPVATCPLPHIAEHALMKRLGKAISQDFSATLSTAACPGGSTDDIFLLSLVEISSACDPRLL